MASIYSVRFLQAVAGSGPYTYTVPAGKVAIARDLDAYGNVIGASSIFLEGALGQAIWYAAWNPTDDKAQSWRGRQVYESGDVIKVQCNPAPLDGIDFTLSGYLLVA